MTDRMEGFHVRRATTADADVLARHRAEMFRDMGKLPAECRAAMTNAARAYFHGAIPSGEYMGWVASHLSAPDEVIGGAGMQLRPLLPSIRVGPAGTEVTTGMQGFVLNVFVERTWRSRGVARLLMRHVLDEAERLGLAQVALHASDEGRPLYESLGFRPTNEMRWGGPGTRDGG